ncbi:12933_t:CDS:2 [Dentiscutata erythropus]|uniref:12933_t:CDS:1 n=1 Tax=Dentiscutata erythropus TaxID=1348616 RepID=A0A9N9IEE0_9GLOM|nr:12933_t:CDS:2 [Dentiscutata erythropus]
MTLPSSTDIIPLHQYNGSPCQYGECTECGEWKCFFIRNTQSHATESMAYFEWIPYENFVLIEQIASDSALKKIGNSSEISSAYLNNVCYLDEDSFLIDDPQ